MKLRAPEDAPQSMHKFARRIVEAIMEPWDTPLRLQPYTVATLPPASKWVGGMVLVSDIPTIALSDGTDWYPITLGAAL